MEKQSNLTVKYQNKLNLITLTNFNAKEMDLFFALCAKMKDQGIEPIVFSFEELKELSNYKITATSHFIKDLDSLYSKMLQLTYREGLFDDDNDGFRELLDIPKSYQMFNIDQRILNPALKELNGYFKDLKLEKIKAKKGNKIEKLKFTFDGLQSDLPEIPMHNWLEN